jgi:hypothetical protein
MTTRETIAAWLLKTKTDVQEIAHGRWNSSRLWTVVALFGALICADRLLLTQPRLELAAHVAIAYIGFNTLSKVGIAFANAWIANTKAKYPVKDTPTSVTVTTAK